jgi:hypothetical protein
MELLNRYLQAVRFWLPKGQPEDLIAELSEDLHSQIEEKETELGRPLEEAEISAILKRCGSPLVVASRFRPQRHLIGPALFPIYAFVLKMVLLWILVPVFVFIVGPVNLANTGNWGLAISHTLGDLWTGAFVAAGVITLVFAVIEGTQSHLGLLDKWDPRSLPPVQTQERKTSLAQTVCELAFNVFGFLWLLLVPGHPALLLGPAAAILKPAPMWQMFYVPILLLAFAVILKSAVTLARPSWTWFPLSTQLLQTVLSLIVVNFMINAGRPTPIGEWRPFVVLEDSVQNSAHYIGIAAIVNASILISLAGTWIGLSIAAVVQTWKLMRYLRKQISVAGQIASLHRG